LGNVSYRFHQKQFRANILFFKEIFQLFVIGLSTNAKAKVLIKDLHSGIQANQVLFTS
jgi:hypothetical protein